jgi:translation initiation factor 2B subunit (eIF-2B alpha/beta/delta family)
MMTHPVIEALVENRSQGASRLLWEFITLLEDFHQDELFLSLDKLKKAFPVMAVWLYAEQYFTNMGVDPSTRKAFQAVVRDGRDLTLNAAVSALSRYHKFLTISHSSLVEEVLLSLTRLATVEVICSRSFPACEGAILQQKLNRGGVSVYCVEDWELQDQIMNAEAVLIGADLITDAFIVNKWGSRAIIKESNNLGIPVYVVAEPFKHLVKAEVSQSSLSQDWSRGHVHRSVQVFEKIARTNKINLLPS